jgi:hypothetical protein
VSRLILVALVVAMVGMAWRRLRRPVRSPAGSSPETAIRTANYAAMDEHILSLTCDCGGGLKPIAEASAEHAGQPLRVARLECARCSHERRIYFVEPQVLH